MLSHTRAKLFAPSIRVRCQLLPLPSQIPVFPCHVAVIVHYIRFALLLPVTSRQLGAGCNSNDQGRCRSCIHARFGLHEFGSLEESGLIACLHGKRQWIAIIEEVSVMTRYTFNTFLWMAYIFVQIVLAIHRSPFPSTCAHSSSHSTSSIKWAVGESVNSRYELYGDTSRSSITCSSTCTPPVA